MKLLNFLKRKEKKPIEKELKKYPRKKRKHLRQLWEQWEQGNYIKIQEK
jgi:hypothetical protein